MFKISFLFLSVLLFCNPAFSYTVILKSGKRMEGHLIGQDLQTIQIKCKDGVIVSLRRESIDWKATETQRAREESRQDSTAIEKKLISKDRPSEKSIVEIAREARLKRTGRAKVLRIDQLDTTPEISIVGSRQSSSKMEKPEVGYSETKDRRKEEKYWRSLSSGLRKEVSVLTEKRARADLVCEKAEQKRQTALLKPGGKPQELLPLLETPAECRHAAELEKLLAEAKQRLDLFLEDARRAEVPWHWVE